MRFIQVLVAVASSHQLRCGPDRERFAKGDPLSFSAGLFQPITLHRNGMVGFIHPSLLNKQMPRFQTFSTTVAQIFSNETINIK